MEYSNPFQNYKLYTFLAVLVYHVQYSKICLKCSYDHLSEECSEDRNSPVKCVLCNNSHTVN